MRTYYMEKPDYKVISGRYARPRSKRVFLHRPEDICIVEARPDYTFLVKDAISSESRLPLAGFGFLFGKDMRSAKIDDVANSFYEDSIPILKKVVISAGICYKLISFCMKHRLYIRLVALNNHPVISQSVQLYFSTIQTSMNDLYENGNEDYVPFKEDNKPWLLPLDTTFSEGKLWLHGKLRALLVKADGFDVSSIKQGNGRLISFQSELQVGEQAVIEWVIPYGATKNNDAYELIEDSWQQAYYDTASFYKAHLDRGTKIFTPNSDINRLYDTLRLSSLQMFGSKLNTKYLYPGQGGMSTFGIIYSMEATAWLPMIDRLGYHDEVAKAMDFLLTTQENSVGPEGDITDPRGSFRPHIFWMCETGAVLTMLCSHGLYTQDKEWFMKVEGQIRSACEFIIRERGNTKQIYKQGEAGYGLLPAGRPHDWPDKGQFLFSDAHTWAGLKRASDLYTAFDHPFAIELVNEVADYKRCILDSFNKATYPHPTEMGRLWFASEVHTPAGVEVGCYGGDGPICLITCGVISAEDPIVMEIEWDAIKRGFMTPLFTHIMSGMEDENLANIQRLEAGGDYDLIYVSFSEKVWHRIFMERGDRNRALAYLYSTIAYTTTYDLGITHERFSPQLPWLLPWQPNASANGRILNMIFSSICMSNNECLYLLAGVPEKWLESVIEIQDYEIIGGIISLKTTRIEDVLKIEVNIKNIMSTVLPTKIAYCMPQGWLPISNEDVLKEDTKGWYYGKLTQSSKVVFKLNESLQS